MKPGEDSNGKKDLNSIYDIVGTKVGSSLVIGKSEDQQVAEDALDEGAIDPINFELFSHAMFHALDEGKQTMQRVGVSPVIRDCGEVAMAVYTADGDLALSATGILLHITGMSWAIKSILRLHVDEIYEDDHWFMNDPRIGGIHACDQAVLTPVHYKGELVAWVSCMTHTPEVGAVEPGGITALATERYHDGVMYPCVRIVRKGRLNTDIWRMMEYSVRDPHTMILDNVSKIAGNNRAKKRVVELLDRFGSEDVKVFLRKLIVDSERQAKALIGQFEDGEYFHRTYMDNDTAGHDRLWWIQCTATVEGENLTVDFEGTSDPNPHSGNTAPPGACGGVFTALCGHLFCDIAWNQGLLNAITIKLPEGCVINAPPSASVSNAPQICHLLAATVHMVLNKVRMASELQLELINAMWVPSGGLWGIGGLDQFGRPFASYTLDYMASGMGASPYRDGVDTGAIYYGPESDSADVEAWESNAPVLYLGRSQTPDSYGFGRQRGGASIECIEVIHKAKSGDKTRVGCLGGSGRRFNVTKSCSGAYPAPFNFYSHVEGVSIYDCIEKGQELPHHTDDLEKWAEDNGGVHEIHIMSPFFGAHLGYAYGGRVGGGGGWGDPLEREVGAVWRDLRDMLLSREAAAAVYGVVYAEDGTIDANATAERRKKLMAERLRRGRIPAQEATVPTTHGGV